MQVTYGKGFQLEPSRSAAREGIERLEAELKRMPQADHKTDHTFGPGFYARTITVPAGATLTGRVHTTEHIFFLSKGEMFLATDEGRLHITAPYQAVCRPGMKRAGHAVTECVCTNVHITTETDLLKLEADLVEPENEALEAPEETPCLG